MDKLFCRIWKLGREGEERRLVPDEVGKLLQLLATEDHSLSCLEERLYLQDALWMLCIRSGACKWESQVGSAWLSDDTGHLYNIDAN